MQTSKSKFIVLKHSNTGDAQAVYKDLLEAYEANLAGTLKAETLRTTLQTMKFDKTWNGTCESFLTVWQTKVFELEQLDDMPIPDATKRQWLTRNS